MAIAPALSQSEQQLAKLRAVQAQHPQPPMTAAAAAALLAQQQQEAQRAAQAPGAHPVLPPSTHPAPPPGAPPAAPPGPTFDSTALANIAANQFRVNNQLNALNQTSAMDQTALQQALAALSYQQPRDSLALEEAANRRGALFSSVYGQQLGDLTHKYSTREMQAKQATANKLAAIASQIAALRGGVSIYNEGQAAAAAQRAAQAAAKDPASGEAAGPLNTLGPKPPKPKGGGHYVPVNGRWQLIHAIGLNKWAPGPPPKPKSSKPKGKR